MTTIQPRKPRILVYGDFLRFTGFGQVLMNIVKQLHLKDKYEISVLGINHYGMPYNSPMINNMGKEVPNPYYWAKDIPVFPAWDPVQRDLFGFQRFVNMINEHEYDILFVLQDTFNMMKVRDGIITAKRRKKMKYIFYFPVDGFLKQEWVEDAVKIADVPVAYNSFGKSEILRHDPRCNIEVIPHGCDPKAFYPFDSDKERKEFRESYFPFKEGKNSDDTFIIGNFNRNQPRKDLTRNIMAFNEFIKKYPNSLLYLHSRVNDEAGIDFRKFARAYYNQELTNRLVYPPTESMGADGFPIDMLRKLYAGCDVITSTTQGEGNGNYNQEAMMVKTPLVVPDNTSHKELIGENNERGYLVKSGGENINLWTVQKNDDQPRPLTDIEDLITQWEYVYNNREEAKQKAEVAYKWVNENLTWEKIGNQWEKLIDETYRSLSN